MITISCAELMSYDKRFNLWGDAFNYNSVSSYTISSRISGDTNLNSIWPAWSGMSGLIETGLGYYGFNINGVNFGTGKITSFNFEEGNDIQYKKYTMSFEIFETGNLYNLTGVQYSEIATSIFDSNFPYFNDFQEEIQISIGENGIQETNQTISFGIDDPVVLKNQARNKIFSGFARDRIPNVGVFTTFPNVILSGNGSGYISYYNESYDLNNRYSFSRRSIYGDNTRATWEYSHEFDYNGSDITLTENGTVNSIYYVGTGYSKNLSGAREKWAEISGGIYSRLSGLFNSFSGWSGILGSITGCPLINLPIDRRWQEDPFAGTIQYAYTYSNNPSYSQSGYIYSNSRQVSVDNDGYYSISENGEYQGVSPDKTQRFAQASGGYYSGLSSIPGRITGSFLIASGLNDQTCVGSGNFYLVNDSVTYEKYQGRISYSKEYSSSPVYYTGNSNFIKYSNTITDRRPVHLTNKFLVPFVGEIAQSAGQSVEGGWSNSIEIFGKSGVGISDYLNEVFNKVVRPSGSGIFLKSMNYSFNPFENSFQANFEYSYSRYRGRNDIIV